MTRSPLILGRQFRRRVEPHVALALPVGLAARVVGALGCAHHGPERHCRRDAPLVAPLHIRRGGVPEDCVSCRVAGSAASN